MTPARPYIVKDTESLGPLRGYLKKRRFTRAYEVDRRDRNGNRMIGLSLGKHEKCGLVVVCDDSLFPEAMAIIERKAVAVTLNEDQSQ